MRNPKSRKRVGINQKHNFMKNLFYLIIISLVFIACNNKQIEETTFIPIDNEVGKIHNEGLARIFAKLNITPNTDQRKLYAIQADLLEQAVSIINEDIRVQAGESAYLQAQQMITKDIYMELTPASIQAQMSNIETLVIEETITAVSNQAGAKPVQQIKVQIIEDNSLSNTEKQRLLDMIDIIESSYIYWTEEIDASGPEKIRVGNQQKVSVRNQQIVAADCIWFWQAGLASGLNPYVTIGASAVGSFAAWLNSR